MRYVRLEMRLAYSGIRTNAHFFFLRTFPESMKVNQ